MSDTEAEYIEVLEPEAAHIARFAERACQTLSESVSQEFADAEVVHGFGEVLQVVAQIGAQLLSDTLNNALDTQFQELQEAVEHGELSDEKTVSFGDEQATVLGEEQGMFSIDERSRPEEEVKQMNTT